ncbi:hypothetical protein KZX06_10350 [Micrococcus sp. EYE_162]|uniref:hypothetical protein n=1 Tax=unclassified Micrococcus TaxID=2620948 RepID=UPI002002C432|nr:MULTISPECIES: hypothetical protein [unclassified Micrococcus]MCK6095797.1 hypothetical protein [Micrococcus sp. EYE_212]MCK6172412.1 hypothetical protein [Micrococcus sp. EYE_162]
MEASTQARLAGPRGRRLCLEAARALSPRVADLVFWLGHELAPDRGGARLVWAVHEGSCVPVSPPTVSPDEVAGALTGLDLSGFSDDVVQSALVSAVESARYWQEPDGEDVLAGQSVIRAALAPVAAAVVASPASRPWGRPRQPVQWVADWRDFEDPTRLTRHPGRVLSEWAQEERLQEARATVERPADPTANWSGSWWSIPQGVTAGFGQIPAGLDLVEDALGAEAATVIPVQGAGRTYEIHAPGDWVRLCREFPLEVSASRRHDWYRVTGRSGRWVIPDWEQVASEWDAVHLTTMGYLSSATRALSVDADAATVLAGWGPDTTVWLTDTVRESDEPRQSWHRGPGGGWIRCATAADIGSAGPARAGDRTQKGER